MTPWLARLRDDPATRALFFVAASLGVALTVGVGLRSGRPSGQTFALFGLQKQLVMPVVYVVAAGAVLVPFTRTLRPARVPAWCVVVAVGLFAGIATDFGTGAAPPLGDLVQGTALLVGWIVFCLLGLHCASWPTRTLDAFLLVITLGGLVVAVGGVDATPFVALGIPSGWIALFVALRRRSAFFFAVAAVSLTSSAISVVTARDASMAVIGQTAICAAIFALALMPPALSVTSLVIAAGVAATAFAVSDLPGLIVGQWQHQDDVTLAQRGFETAAVRDEVGASPWTLLFGAGPAGAVDLTRSPDTATLLASGRYLPAVDGVHLLTTWALLKGGLIGLTWVALFLFAAAHRLVAVLCARRRSELELCLVLLLWSGIVMALPAATHLFVNPLPAFSLGVLAAIRRPSGEPAPGAATPAAEVLDASQAARTP